MILRISHSFFHFVKFKIIFSHNEGKSMFGYFSLKMSSVFTVYDGWKAKSMLMFFNLSISPMAKLTMYVSVGFDLTRCFFFQGL